MCDFCFPHGSGGITTNKVVVSGSPLYEWDIEVRRLNTYGDRIKSRTPAKVLASTKAEVTTKVRAMFGATYDDFRKFWSHTWVLNSVQEVQRPVPPTEETEAGDDVGCGYCGESLTAPYTGQAAYHLPCAARIYGDSFQVGEADHV